mmetsp:Transcript_12970/g.16660  ORF Transcript_12970/g.16660 Transcript_12970/m.16660 type:complete len:297 (+) Transcript_12970:521-1411(+)
MLFKKRFGKKNVLLRYKNYDKGALFYANLPQARNVKLYDNYGYEKPAVQYSNRVGFTLGLSSAGNFGPSNRSQGINPRELIQNNRKYLRELSARNRGEVRDWRATTSRPRGLKYVPPAENTRDLQTGNFRADLGGFFDDTFKPYLEGNERRKYAISKKLEETRAKNNEDHLKNQARMFQAFEESMNNLVNNWNNNTAVQGLAQPVSQPSTNLDESIFSNESELMAPGVSESFLEESPKLLKSPIPQRPKSTSRSKGTSPALKLKDTPVDKYDPHSALSPRKTRKDKKKRRETLEFG